MKFKKKNLFYLLLFFLLIVTIEIILFYFLNWQWNLKKRPHGENNYLTKYYKSFHPLFRDLSHLSNDLIVYDKHLYYKLKSNSFLFRNYGEERLSTIEVDKFGFSHNGNKNLNKNFFKKKKYNEKRVIFIGGSTTFGTGASSNVNTYPAQVAKILRQELLQNKLDVMFLNAGVIGYTVSQDFLYLKNYLIKLDPDVLIFLSGSNNAYMSLIQKKFDKNFHDMKIKKNDNKKNIFSFPQKLYLLNFSNRCYYVIRSYLNKTNFFNIKKNNLNSYYHREASIELKKNITDIINLANQKEIKTFFYLQPNIFYKNNYTNSEKKQIHLLESQRPDFKKNMVKHHKDFQKLYKELQNIYSNNSNFLFKDISIDFMDNLKYKFTYQSWAHFDDSGYNALANIIANDIQILLNK